MTGEWWQYLVIFFTSAVICSFLTPVFLRLAFKTGSLANTKDGDLPVPHLGGLAIVSTFSLSVVLAAFIEQPHDGLNSLILVVALALILAVVGHIDDRRTLSPGIRLFVQFFCAFVVWLLDEGVSISQIEIFDLLITIFWIVGVTNAFNLLDNMDGLSAGLATISSLAFFAIASANGQYLVAALSLAVAGCSIGFLRHNFYPAKIYMGDAGSLFIGFLVSYLGLKLRFESPVSRSFVVPIVVCLPAILDTTVVVFSRIWYRKSPFLGGKDHISHRLVKTGFSIPISVSLIYGVSVCFGIIGFTVSRVETISAWVLVALAFLIFSVCAGFSWMIPVYEESKQKHFLFSWSENK